MTLTYRRPLTLNSTALRAAAAALALLLVTGTALSRAWADEEDDIQRQIDVQKSGVADLEHLDRQHAATSEIQRLRDWLGQAWDLRNKHEPDDAREVLERCVAQAELVRQVITTAQLKAQVSDREAKLASTKAETEKKKKALLDAQVKKRALDGGAQ
jgi:hypothetical protein